MSAVCYQYMISKEGCSKVVPVPSLLLSSFYPILKPLIIIIINIYELLSAEMTNHSAAVNSTDTELVLLHQ